MLTWPDTLRRLARPQNPYYDETVDERGKKKRTRRPMPEGLTPKEQKILTKVRRRAYRLDKVRPPYTGPQQESRGVATN